MSSYLNMDQENSALRESCDKYAARIAELEVEKAGLWHVINDLSSRLDLTPDDVSDLRKRLTAKETT